MLALTGAGAPAAETGEAAVVVSATGTVSVERADGTFASLSSGAKVARGDIVTTQSESFAHLRFTDGGELALRPNTRMRVDQYSYRPAAPQSDGVVMTLLKGGLRAITGAVARRSRDAYQVKTTTATIGVRGTDFIARLCERDCVDEQTRLTQARRTAAPPIAARVAILQGTASAADRTGGARPLAVGSPIYPGEIIETGAASHAVLLFLDEGRITLEENSRFAVERFRYEKGRETAGQVSLRLLKGGLRALTGLVARARPQNFRMQTTTATIGVRGTGFDVRCTGPCETDVAVYRAAMEAEDGVLFADLGPATPAGAERMLLAQAGGGAGGMLPGFYVFTWSGTVELLTPQGSVPIAVNQVVFLGAKGDLPQFLQQLPGFFGDNPAPRPDLLKLDLEQLFGKVLSGFGDGLYVFVKGGSVSLTQQNQTIFLVMGEAGAALLKDGPFVLQTVPLFLLEDRYLGPPLFDPKACTF